MDFFFFFFFFSFLFFTFAFWMEHFEWMPLFVLMIRYLICWTSGWPFWRWKLCLESWRRVCALAGDIQYDAFTRRRADEGHKSCNAPFKMQITDVYRLSKRLDTARIINFSKQYPVQSRQWPHTSPLWLPIDGSFGRGQLFVALSIQFFF